ncbi:MAG: hypothetical protein LBV55_00940 [Acholeplasmatales bacterium]|jgi:hypothetical protein|nr:hypothetical protein [Acholeplasmatales bacterium]
MKKIYLVLLSFILIISFVSCTDGDGRDIPPAPLLHQFIIRVTPSKDWDKDRSNVPVEIMGYSYGYFNELGDWDPKFRDSEKEHFSKEDPFVNKVFGFQIIHIKFVENGDHRGYSYNIELLYFQEIPSFRLYNSNKRFVLDMPLDLSLVENTSDDTINIVLFVADSLEDLSQLVQYEDGSSAYMGAELFVSELKYNPQQLSIDGSANSPT